MEAIPSRRLGLFGLGMPLGDAINCILSNFGHGHTLIYDAANPLRNPVAINIHEANTKLFFSPTSQDLMKLTVSRPWPDEVFLVQDQGRVRICTNEEPLTFDQLKSFPLRLRQNILRSRHRCQVVCNGIAFTFDPDTLFLRKISIFHGGSDVKPSVPPTFSVYHPVGMYAVRFIDLTRRQKMSQVVGLKIGLTCCRTELRTGDIRSIASEDVVIENFERYIMFGDMLQDVLTDLGAPEKSYYQEKPSRLLTQDRHEVLLETVPSCDLYLNYESLGLDVVINEKSREVSQIVLHCNFPGHCDFYVYRRCPFKLDIPCCCRHVVKRKCPLNAMEHQILTVTPVTKWTEISKHVVCGDACPIAMLRRQSATNDPNNFSSSTLYVFDQLVFEVMSNDHIATVTILCDSPLTTCSSGDRSPHQPLAGSLATVEDATGLQGELTYQSVAFHIAAGPVESAKSKKPPQKPKITNDEAFFVPLEEDESVKTSQLDLGHHHWQDGGRNSKISDKADNKAFPCDPALVLPIPAANSFNDDIRKQLDDSSVQAYCDGFSAHRELARSPPQHASIPNGDSLVEGTLIQEQQDQANPHIVDTSEKTVSSGLLESQPDTEMFFDAENTPEGMRSSWSLSVSPDPAMHSLSSLISNTGRQDYVSWEDIDAVHTDVLCQLKQRARVVKDIGNMWVSGNPSRAVTMLCSSMEGNTRTSENKQLLPPQDADTAAVINLLGVFNTNDSHFSVPVSLELLPKLERLMATSSLMEDSHSMEVFSIISLITKKFGRSVVISTPGTTTESKRIHREKAQCKEILKTIKSHAQSMCSEMKRSKTNSQLLKALQVLNCDLTIIH